MDPVTAPDKPKLLVVDDDAAILRQLKWALGDEFHVLLSSSSEQAWAILGKENPDVVALDLALARDDPETGFTLLDGFLGEDPYLKIVLITGKDTREHALRAVDRGAFDYFTKPVDTDELRLIIRRAVTLRRLERENAELRRRVKVDRSLGRIMGRSPAMEALFEDVRKVATAPVHVLVAGEGGTGKEIVAQEIHRLSPRRDGPFVSLSCGGIPPESLEEELFGFEGDSEEHAAVGGIEASSRGTLFLDELIELPASAQIKFAQVLRENQVVRLGSGRPVPVDLRIVSSATGDLRPEVKAGRLREDLFFALAEVSLRVPPLRERSEDVVYLARVFLDRYAAEFGRRSLAFSRDALRVLQRHDWPGNVQELQHRVQQAVILAPSRQVRAEDLELAGSGDFHATSLREARETVERTVVTEALRRNCGNIARAARELEVSRPTLHDLLRKLDISAREFKDGLGPGWDEG